MIIVIGCSTSEVAGKKIGSASNMDIAEAIMAGLLPVATRTWLTSGYSSVLRTLEPRLGSREEMPKTVRI